MNYSRESSFADYGIMVPAGKTGNGVRCECPECSGLHKRRDKTLSVDTERRLFNCFRCGWAGRVGGASKSNIIELDPVRTAAQEKEKKQKADKDKGKLSDLFSSSYPLQHPEAKPSREYLSNRLGGHKLPELPDDLRHHRNLAYFDAEINKFTGNHPAMLAVVRDVTGKGITLHRTYITQDGKKSAVGSPKKLMPPVWPATVTGGAIQLYKPIETLILAEGIETALSLTVSLDEPCWATISAHGLSKVILPDSVRTVIIGADRDKSGTGQRYAHYLEERMISEGRKVQLMLPDTEGMDWADILNNKEDES